MSAQVRGDGSVHFRGGRIGRVRPVAGRWTWVAEGGVDAPILYPTRKAAIAALVRYHLARNPRAAEERAS